MDRRLFIGMIAAGLADVIVDPEQLLWRRSKTIFLPPVRPLDRSGAAINALLRQPLDSWARGLREAIRSNASDARALLLVSGERGYFYDPSEMAPRMAQGLRL